MTIEEPKARNRRKLPAAPTTPDPVEIAMEIAASGQTPGDAALEVLQTNAALMREQIDVAREEANLSRDQAGLARRQTVLANNQIFRNRILAAVVVALIVAVGTVVWSASRTTGLVIQPFSVPPALAEDGLDGRAAAALFQDELIRLEAATVSARPPASFRNDWSEAITVEVEAGGLSLTDAYTALTRWLGQETYVSGGLSRTPDGLELVVRSRDGTTVTVQGDPADNPGDLMRTAAERVYEQIQPYRYALYLQGRAIALPAGPEQDALLGRRRAILTTLLDSPSQTDRLWALIGLAGIRDTMSVEGSVSNLRAALEIDPEHPDALADLWLYLAGSGHAEASLGSEQRLLASLSNPRNRAKVAEDRQQLYLLRSTARVAALQGDGLQELELYTRLLNSDLPTASEYRDERVRALITLHQPSALQRLIAEDDLRARGGGNPGNGRPGLRASAAADLDQWPQALAALEAREAERDPTVPMRLTPDRQSIDWPRLAYARARTGDMAGAQTLIAATPLNCYPCVRERARIAELAGDRAGADRWSPRRGVRGRPCRSPLPSGARC